MDRNYEEIIFYIDLAQDYLGKEDLKKELSSFIQEKKKFSDSTFGIVIFQEDDNPITLYEKKDPKLITEIVNKHWDSRPKSQSYIENGLFEILSHIFQKGRTEDKIHRIIVISDTQSKRSEEYHQAVYDLIVKSKNFSTYVDIIRIGEIENYEDDIKIKVISSETQGGIFYCDAKQFNDVFGSLIKSKQEFNIIRGEEGQILEEDKTFYERLAADLITLDSDEEPICSICEQEICPICEAFTDEIHKCYNCNAKFHGCCVSKYSIIKNIGFNHIFRCPHCETLLKLDEDYVNLVFDEEFEEIQELKQKQIKLLETQAEIIVKEIIEQESETEDAPIIEEIVEPQIPLEDAPVIKEIVKKEDLQKVGLENVSIASQDLPEPPSLQRIEIPLKKPSLEKVEIPPAPPPEAPPEKKIKLGGYFGQEVTIQKTKEIKIVSSTSTSMLKEKLSITTLKPPKKRASLKFCKICGETVKHVIKCPNCGATID